MSDLSKIVWLPEVVGVTDPEEIAARLKRAGIPANPPKAGTRALLWKAGIATAFAGSAVVAWIVVGWMLTIDMVSVAVYFLVFRNSQSLGEVGFSGFKSKKGGAKKNGDAG